MKGVVHVVETVVAVLFISVFLCNWFPYVSFQTDELSGLHTRSILCKPIRNRHEQIIGKVETLLLV